MNEQPLAVSVKRAAAMLDFKSSAPVYALIDRGELPVVPNLKPLRVPVSAIKKYVEGR